MPLMRSACHQVAAAMELPLLTILCNNARWHAVQNAAQTLYPDGHASKHKTPVPLADLSPTPAFEKYAEASGGYGEVVSDPARQASCDVILDVLQEQRERAIVGLNSAGQVREVQLRQRLRFRLRTPGGKELIADTEILQTRDMSFSETLALAKDAEERLLYRDMQTDTVQQLMRRLAAVKSL